MSVLNPFFRQQVQDPGGVSTGATPMVDTWTDEMKMKNALIDEQLKAVNASFSAYGAFVEAKAQIKEEENKQILRDVANVIAQDATTMVQGYKNQGDFQIGKYKVEKGKKGFHAYSDLDGQVDNIKQDLLSRLEESYNPNGEDKLSERIKSAVEGAFIDPTAQSDEHVRNHINNRALRDLREVGLQSLDQFNSINYNAVLTYDNSVDEKSKSGALSDLKAEQEKIEWRKDAFKKIILDKLPSSATLEDKRRYIDWFNNILEYKTKGKYEDEYSPAEKQFYEKLSVLDIRELNRGLGGPAFTVLKEDQLTTLNLMSMKQPLETANMIGYELLVVPDSKGKPSYVRVIPKSGEEVEHTFTAKEGYGTGFMSKWGDHIDGNSIDEKWETLIGYQTEEVGKRMRLYINEKEDWPKGDKFVFFKKDEKETEVSKLENILKKQGFPNVSHSEMVKILKNASKEALTRARASHGKGTYKDNETELKSDVAKFIGEWNAVFTKTDTYVKHGFLFPDAVRPPIKPFIKHAETEAGYEVWDSYDNQIQKLRGSITDGDIVMNEASFLLKKIDSAKINLGEFDGDIKEIKAKLMFLKFKDKDGLQIGTHLESILEKSLFAPYNRFKRTWSNQKTKEDNRIGWCLVKVETAWSGKNASDQIKHREAIKCTNGNGIRPFEEIGK